MKLTKDKAFYVKDNFINIAILNCNQFKLIKNVVITKTYQNIILINQVEEFMNEKKY